MKLLLVYPRTKYPSGDIPIGLSILCALAKKEGVDVSLYDASFSRDPYGEFKKAISKTSFDVVGFSVMTTTIRAAAKMAAEVKKTLPEAKIIAGGPHATALPDKTINDLKADACFTAESENSFQKYLNGEPLENIPGVCRVVNGELLYGPPATFISDLDTIPYPDISLFDVDEYLSKWFSLDGVTVKSRGVNIIGTRGCPFKCSFCQPTLSRMFGKNVRKHSPEYIVEMLSFLKRDYGINSFMFEDDTFTADRNWSLSVCEAIRRSGLGMYWGCNSHVNTIEESALSEMKRAGLRKIYIGVESANQRVLDDVYDKGFTLKKAEEKIRVARNMGIKTHAYFIIGAPTETEEEIENTISFAAKSQLDVASYSICTPLPGTALYEKYRDSINGCVEDMDYYNKPVFKEGVALHPDRLKKLRRKALVKFYSRPRRLAALAAGAAQPGGAAKLLLKLKRA